MEVYRCKSSVNIDTYTRKCPTCLIQYNDYICNHYFLIPIHQKRVNTKPHVSGIGSNQVLRPTKKFKTFSIGNIHRLPSTCYHLHVPTVLKYGSLNRLEPSGPVQACNGIPLPLPLTSGKLASHKPATYVRLMSGKLRSTGSD